MHEYSLASALISQVERAAAPHSGATVRRVHVRVGAESGVVPELLQTAFEAIRPDTVCAGSSLVLERVDLRWACPPCPQAEPLPDSLRCPNCGGPLELSEGMELVLQRIELEHAPS